MQDMVAKNVVDWSHFLKSLFRAIYSHVLSMTGCCQRFQIVYMDMEGDSGKVESRVTKWKGNQTGTGN